MEPRKERLRANPKATNTKKPPNIKMERNDDSHIILDLLGPTSPEIKEFKVESAMVENVLVPAKIAHSTHLRHRCLSAGEKERCICLFG
jgi:hypothetical protein